MVALRFLLVRLAVLHEQIQKVATPAQAVMSDLTASLKEQRHVLTVEEGQQLV